MAGTNKTGQLEKLIIKAFTKADYSASPVAEFKVLFNPEEYQRVYDIEYEEGQGKGTTGSPMKFKRIKPQDYTLKFTIDGTGAAGEKADVPAKVKEFFDVVGYDGNIHRPRYLQVIWGTLKSNCVLLKAETTYKLFKPDGTPLRAVITSTFRENVDDSTRAKKENKKSPDLTHVRVIKEGDSLPLMAYEIYGDAAYYIAVAKANGMSHFRELKAGDRVLFPPLEKVSRG
jgi:Contractile injection system tube protein